jgi:hypothetical protein
MKPRVARVTVLLVFLGFCVTVGAVHAEIFKWIDEKGTVHFTEDPATIPEKYRDKVKSRATEEFSESSEERTPTLRKNPKYIYQPKRQSSMPKHVNKDSQECGSPGQTDIVFFLPRYCGGARTPIALECEEILKKCCNYSDREFAEIAHKGAKDSKGKIIPRKIPGLLRWYCGQSGPDIIPDGDTTQDITSDGRTTPPNESSKPHQNPGAINPRTGEFYPGVADGIINPRTGEFYPDVGGGYIKPRTGEFIPKQ